jgi:hypothetical protein
MSQYIPTNMQSGVPTRFGESEPARASVAAFLNAFSARETWSHVVRGGSIAIVLFLVGACLIAAIDWLFTISDSVRWALTSGLYVATLLTAWWMGFKRLFQTQSAENLAWSIEQSAPSLRESLIAAVSLRGPDDAIRSGSRAFVDAIEQNVASEIGKLEMDSLLPWKSIIKYLCVAIGSLSIVLIACSLPGGRIAGRLVRAMVPFVSLDRISQIQIKVLEPDLRFLSIPSDQIVSFAIEVTGGTPDIATVEFIESKSVVARSNTNSATSRDMRRLLEMNPVSTSPLRFSISAPITDRQTQFRFLAGDAVTRWWTIDPISRPKAIAFHSEVSPPAYAKSPTVSQSSPRGDLKSSTEVPFIWRSISTSR